MLTPSELHAKVRKFRAGETYKPSYDPDSVGWSRVIAPVVSVAAADVANQLERLDRLSLPILTRPGPDGGLVTVAARTSPARTARLFLNQLRSDYRRVAFPNIHLEGIEEHRQTAEWESALKKQRIRNCSLAVLAVGQYLASEPSQDINLETALKPWLAADDRSDAMEWFESKFGPVVGPLVSVALSRTPAQVLLEEQQLPGWASEVGDDVWSAEFLFAGGQELNQVQQRARQYREVAH